MDLGTTLSVRLRRLVPEDLGALRGFVDGLDAIDRCRRYGALLARPGAPVPFLMRLIEVDPDLEMGLAATIDWAGGSLIVGEGRGTLVPGQGAAAVSLVVASRWRRLGIGRRLLRELGVAARRRGLRRLSCATSGDNLAMQALALSEGYQRVPNPLDARLAYALEFGDVHPALPFPAIHPTAAIS